MKKYYIFISLLSISTGFTSTFDRFQGIYKPSSIPVVTNSNMNYCNWMGFKDMTEVSLMKDTKGVDVFTITSYSSAGSPLKVSYEFKEFNTTGQFGAYSKGVIISDELNSQFQISNVIPNEYAEIFTFNFSKSNTSTTHLYLAYQTHGQFGVNGACYYNVDITKY